MLSRYSNDKPKIIPIPQTHPIYEILKENQLENSKEFHVTSEGLSQVEREARHIQDLSKWFKPLKWTPKPYVLQQAVELFTDRVESMRNYFTECKIASFSEFKEFITKNVNGNKSPGEPYTRKWQTKMLCFLANEDWFLMMYNKVFVTKEITFENLPQILKVNDKEEFLSQLKFIVKKKKRTFMGADMLCFMISWCLFTHFHRIYNKIPFHKKRTTCGQSEFYGGYQEWITFAMVFKNMFKRDMGSFDGTVQKIGVEYCALPWFRILPFYLEYCKLIRSFITYTYGWSTVVTMWGLVINIRDGTRSGVLTTLLMNGEYCLFSDYYVWADFCDRYTQYLLHQRDLYIADLDHGDDDIGSTSLDEYTPEFVHESAADLGLIANIERIESYDKIEYLSKTPVFLETPHCEMVIAFKPNYLRLQKVLYYTKRMGDWNPYCLYYQKLAAIKPFTIWEPDLWLRIHKVQLAVRTYLLVYEGTVNLTQEEKDIITKTPIFTREDCASMFFPELHKSGYVIMHGSTFKALTMRRKLGNYFGSLYRRGNYGGAGWSNGVEQDSVDVRDINFNAQDQSMVPIDDLDEAHMHHDGDMVKIGERKADKNLRKRLQKISGPAAWIQDKAFALKDKLDLYLTEEEMEGHDRPHDYGLVGAAVKGLHNIFDKPKPKKKASGKQELKPQNTTKMKPMVAAKQSSVDARPLRKVVNEVVQSTPMRKPEQTPVRSQLLRKTFEKNLKKLKIPEKEKKIELEKLMKTPDSQLVKMAKDKPQLSKMPPKLRESRHTTRARRVYKPKAQVKQVEKQILKKVNNIARKTKGRSRSRSRKGKKKGRSGPRTTGGVSRTWVKEINSKGKTGMSFNKEVLVSTDFLPTVDGATSYTFAPGDALAVIPLSTILGVLPENNLTNDTVIPAKYVTFPEVALRKASLYQQTKITEAIVHLVNSTPPLGNSATTTGRIGIAYLPDINTLKTLEAGPKMRDTLQDTDKNNFSFSLWDSSRKQSAKMKLGKHFSPANRNATTPIDDTTTDEDLRAVSRGVIIVFCDQPFKIAMDQTACQFSLQLQVTFQCFGFYPQDQQSISMVTNVNPNQEIHILPAQTFKYVGIFQDNTTNSVNKPPRDWLYSETKSKPIWALNKNPNTDIYEPSHCYSFDASALAGPGDMLVVIISVEKMNSTTGDIYLYCEPAQGSNVTMIFGNMDGVSGINKTSTGTITYMSAFCPTTSPCWITPVIQSDGTEAAQRDFYHLNFSFLVSPQKYDPTAILNSRLQNRQQEHDRIKMLEKFIADKFGEEYTSLVESKRLQTEIEPKQKLIREQLNTPTPKITTKRECEPLTESQKSIPEEAKILWTIADMTDDEQEEIDSQSEIYGYFVAYQRCKTQQPLTSIYASISKFTSDEVKKMKKMSKELAALFDETETDDFESPDFN